jgi:hypothetical protein
VSRGRALALAALLAGPGAAAALEPRFDHRDQQGPVLEALVAYDTVSISGEPTRSGYRPALRLAWGADVTGDGDELVAGLTGSLRSWSDPGRTRVLLAADLRYRIYFGTEELKTFFDVGLWAPLRSRLAVGPLAGIGLQYDISRAGGFFASGGFGTAFGQVRVASFLLSAGAQLRFE